MDLERIDDQLLGQLQSDEDQDLAEEPIPGLPRPLWFTAGVTLSDVNQIGLSMRRQ